jgi:dihydropteroate synthase
MPGTPRTMMKNTNYFDVVLDVYDFLEERIKFCESKGIDRNNIIIDPGIGFGKKLDDNIKLLKQLSIFHTLDCPIMLGISRKRCIRIHRVHDVKEVRQAIDVFEKINEK